MKKDEQIEFVTSAKIEIYNIHDPVCLLKQIQCLFPLLPFYELNRRVIKFTENNRDFIFRNT